MRYFNYKVKTKNITPKITFTAVASLLCTSSVPKGWVSTPKKLYYTNNFAVLHVKLQSLTGSKKLWKEEQESLAPEARASAEVWGGEKKKRHHVLPINTNTTFNSTVSVLSCTATHRHNVLHAHNPHLIADNRTTICRHKKRNLPEELWAISERNPKKIS